MDESEFFSEAKSNKTDLEKKVTDLETENKRVHGEFNIQRAKMRDLYMQKENDLMLKTQENQKLSEQIHDLQTELDEARSQVVVTGITMENNIQDEKRKAEEEVASLQQFILETIEENSTSKSLFDSQVGNLKYYIQQLEREIVDLKRQQQQSPHSQEHGSLAPSVVLNALTKGIAKKLGADSFGGSQDSADENSRKEYDHFYEDPEVLRSLVGPLEDQIRALKEKLRSTDEELQKYKECSSLNEVDRNSIASSLDKPPDSQKAVLCDMCSNYEEQLVKEQKRGSELEAKVLAAEKSADRHKEELLKEIGFRKEMEEKWNEKREELKQQVSELTRSTECTEQDLKEMRQYFDQVCGELRKTLASLTQDREKIHHELEKLQKENDNLVGKYSVHSHNLQSEAINLPNTVEELHELVLNNHQDLIIAKIGKEAAEEKVNNLQSDIMLLKDQITNDQHEKMSLENNLVQEINSLKARKDQLETEKRMYLSNQERLEHSDKAHSSRINELQKEIQELIASKNQYTDLNNELRNRVSSLQQELSVSETVQKDFVLLSQNLQVQLEKIRSCDSQVRWQHEDDVDKCPHCHLAFSNLKRKTHCRHCGQIFCHQCITRSVNSGPSMRPAKVCDVCHTLLVQTSAPYFSETPPTT